MGQSAARRISTPRGGELRLDVSIFQTEFGWFLLAGKNKCLTRILLGHPGAEAAERALERELPPGTFTVRADWHPQLRRRIEDYCAKGCRLRRCAA